MSSETGIENEKDYAQDDAMFIVWMATAFILGCVAGYVWGGF